MNSDRSIFPAIVVALGLVIVACEQLVPHEERAGSASSSSSYAYDDQSLFTRGSQDHWPIPAPRALVSIPYCWTNATAADATLQTQVLKSFNDAWGRYANIQLVGGHPCGPADLGIAVIRIRLEDGSGRGTSKVGPTVSGNSPDQWTLRMHRGNFNTRTTVHEMGHAIGFEHEQKRSDTPESCRSELDPNDSAANNEMLDGGIFLGVWDAESVMNYCANVLAYPHLSTGDIAGVQLIYGSRGIEKCADFMPAGGILFRWYALGGVSSALGCPTSNEMDTADNIGRFNLFTGGGVFWKPGTDAYAVQGPLFTKYVAMGRETGVLGYPTSNELVGAGGVGRVNTFEKGIITWKPDQGAFAVINANAAKYKTLGREAGQLGYATSDELTTQDGKGRFNTFERGVILWSPDTEGSFAVSNSHHNVYVENGRENGALGYPTSDENPILRGAARINTFQNGAILSSSATSTVAVHGGMHEKYKSLGREEGALGLPITAVERLEDGSLSQVFQDGAIFWTATHEFKAITGPSYGKFAGLGGVSGALGYPKSDTAPGPDGEGLITELEKGNIYVSPGATGAVAITQPLLARYVAMGATQSVLGYPASDEIVASEGSVRYVNFPQGSLVSSPVGVFEVHGIIYTAWQKVGGINGKLGYPTSDVTEVPGGLQSTFQRGKVIVDSTGRAVVHADNDSAGSGADGDPLAVRGGCSSTGGGASASAPALSLLFLILRSWCRTFRVSKREGRI